MLGSRTPWEIPRKWTPRCKVARTISEETQSQNFPELPAGARHLARDPPRRCRSRRRSRRMRRCVLLCDDSPWVATVGAPDGRVGPASAAAQRPQSRAGHEPSRAELDPSLALARSGAARLGSLSQRAYFNRLGSLSQRAYFNRLGSLWLWLGSDRAGS